MKIKAICVLCYVEHSRFRDRAKTKPASYCKPCHAMYMRENRPSYGQLDPDAKKRQIARDYARVYLRRGKIQRQSCLMCGGDQAEMHHEDYSKPLEIRWLCRPCHLAVHSGDVVVEFACAA